MHFTQFTNLVQVKLILISLIPGQGLLLGLNTTFAVFPHQQLYKSPFAPLSTWHPTVFKEKNLRLDPAIRFDSPPVK